MKAETGAPPTTLDRLRDLVEEHPVTTAIAFGSVVDGDFTGESDIDLAVEFPDGEDVDRNYDMWEALYEELKEEFDRDIDLLDIHVLSPSVRYEIFETGECLYGEKRYAELRSELDAFPLTPKRARNIIHDTDGTERTERDSRSEIYPRK